MKTLLVFYLACVHIERTISANSCPPNNINSENFCPIFKDNVSDIIRAPCPHPNFGNGTISLEQLRGTLQDLYQDIQEFPADIPCNESNTKIIIQKSERDKALRQLKSPKRFKAALQKIQYFLHVYYSHIVFAGMEDNFTENKLCVSDRSCDIRNREKRLSNQVVDILCLLSTCGINKHIDTVLKEISYQANQKSANSYKNNPEMKDLIQEVLSVNDECNKYNPKSQLKCEMREFVTDLMKVIERIRTKPLECKVKEKKNSRKGKGKKKRKRGKGRKGKGKNRKGKRRKSKTRKGENRNGGNRDNKKVRGRNGRRKNGAKRRRKHGTTAGPVTKTIKSDNGQAGTGTKRRGKQGTTPPTITTTTRSAISPTRNSPNGDGIRETTIGSVTKRNRRSKRRRNDRQKKNPKKNKT